jgi:uncharacterized membrane protein YedE/YeeE
MNARIAAACASGLVMSVGLCLSGMANPTKVLGFLDFLGRWNPTLAFVMLGAVGTHAILYRAITRRTRPILDVEFSIPAKTALDWRLVIGAAVFGAGWGLAGYCPGPVIAALGSGGSAALVFAGGMLGGMAGYGVWSRDPRTPASSLGRSAAPDTRTSGAQES